MATKKPAKSKTRPRKKTKAGGGARKAAAKPAATRKAAPRGKGAAESKAVAKLRRQLGAAGYAKLVASAEAKLARGMDPDAITAALEREVADARINVRALPAINSNARMHRRPR
jgi:hypothetical protein